MEKRIKLPVRAAPGVHETARELLKGERGKILDIAAGSGAFLSSLNKEHFERKACELFSKKFKLKDVPCCSVDLNEGILPYENNSFDLVTAIEIIEHIENPYQFIREVHRVLKPRGKLVLTTPNVTNWYSRLLYLFSLKFANFFDKEDYLDLGAGHITPIFPATIKMLIKDKFKIINIIYNRTHIPILNINLPIKRCRLLGEITILKLEKI